MMAAEVYNLFAIGLVIGAIMSSMFTPPQVPVTKFVSIPCPKDEVVSCQLETIYPDGIHISYNYSPCPVIPFQEYGLKYNESFNWIFENYTEIE